MGQVIFQSRKYCSFLFCFVFFNRPLDGLDSLEGEKPFNPKCKDTNRLPPRTRFYRDVHTREAHPYQVLQD